MPAGFSRMIALRPDEAGAALIPGGNAARACNPEAAP